MSMYDSSFVVPFDASRIKSKGRCKGLRLASLLHTSQTELGLRVKPLDSEEWDSTGH